MSQTPNPAPPELVKLTIDGHEVSAPKGQNVLEASLSAGIDVPYFCYHPGLSSPAVCRQCLVDVKGQPKLAPSCYTPVAEGMVVTTNSEKVLAARAQMLEFTLVNHPVDCPICDKAGECTLQKLYFDWDGKGSRTSHEKVHKPKREDLGPTIVLDAERCILCTRCIRVCDEVAGTHQLEITQRGDRSVLGVAPGTELDNPYSMNTVDVCPVGALTAKDFRFTLRAWELYTTPSICTGCATGCNVELHHREEKIYRIVPRLNPEVNKHWMCDEGRFTYKPVHEHRLAAPIVEGLPAGWERAMEVAVAKLAPVVDVVRGQTGVVLSAQHTNEDNLALLKLAKEFLGLEKIYVATSPKVPAREDKILRVADVDPNARGVFDLAGAGVGDIAALSRDLEAGALKGLIVLGGAPTLTDGAKQILPRLDALIVMSTHDGGIADQAHVALPIAAWPELHGTITNKDGKVQRLRAAISPVGQAKPAWQVIQHLGRRLGAALEIPHARALFVELVEKVPAFAGAKWGPEAPLVQLRFAGSRG